MGMSKKAGEKKRAVEPVVRGEAPRHGRPQADTFDWRTFDPAMLQGGSRGPAGDRAGHLPGPPGPTPPAQGPVRRDQGIGGRRLLSRPRVRRRRGDRRLWARPSPDQEDRGKEAGPPDRARDPLMPIVLAPQKLLRA